MCGGLTDEMDATQEVQDIIDEVKADILKAANLDAADMFKALRYRSQLVAGTNYFVKIQVHDSGDCIHARIYQPLPCNVGEGDKTLQLSSVQTGKKVDDPVEYFE